MSALCKRALRYIKKNGLRTLMPRLKQYIADKKAIKQYYKENTLSTEEIEHQKKEIFAYSPCISIVVPLYNTPVSFFEELTDTIKRQTYVKWELCLADGTGKRTRVSEICEKLMSEDKRIKYKLLEENGGISKNTNAALEMATGEFIMLADHDDLVEQNLLYECVKALNSNEKIDSLYTDEDHIDFAGKRKSEPHFKMDFNIEYLRINNYICHAFFTRRQIALEVGGFDSEYDGAQDYDFILKCVERSREIYHIPKIMYHWRAHKSSTAENPESKLYAYEAGRRALSEHYKRCGIEAVVKNEGSHLGYYVADRIIDNELIDRVKIISESDVKVINEIINRSPQEYVLLLDKDVKSDSMLIKKLLEYAICDDIAAVTCKIIDNRNRVIQGPIVKERDGTLSYSMKGLNKNDPGYFRRSVEPQDVTAADFRCVMLKREQIFLQGGLDENKPLRLAVYDYSINAEKNGKRTVFTPYVKVKYFGKKVL